MKRRDFITLVGGTAAGWPLATRAQQAESMRRVAVWAHDYSQGDREGQARIAAFLDTLRKQGWSEGRNVHIEYRWGGAGPDRLNATAAELIHSSPDVILASGNIALAELHRLTGTVPIVFIQVSDSVGSGFVTGLARPGGNISGFENFEPAMGSKWLEVLKEAAPNVTRVAALFGSNSTANHAFLDAAYGVAPALGIAMTAIDVQTSEIEPAVTAFASQPDGGLVVMPHSRTISDRGSIMTLAARHRLPAVYPFRYYATEGGLIAYGPDEDDLWRGAATYVDRVLRGEKPGELPVQAPTKFELVVNLKTAKALGLSIPPAFPLRADQVIE
jgi:putative tryptophan/tyrosine transport system substrate-binding protein